MKVFISWSGERSLKVAQVFRNWLPLVLQSIEPYVSSEDIDKGTRWSTDIAQELEYSTFGILCVTKENLNAPWIAFEAGALSRTMDKSHVCPFLFDIKRAEINGPILQFQSTIFLQEDIKKLIISLNKACGELAIKDAVLEKTFSLCYPSLEEELNQIKHFYQNADTPSEETNKPNVDEMIEEVLELSRDNQKLLRIPDNSKLMYRVEKLVETLENPRTREYSVMPRRALYKYNPMFIEELLHVCSKGKNSKYPLIVALSIYKEDFPWVYEAGKETLSILDSKRSDRTKYESFMQFRDIIEITTHHPFMDKRFEPMSINGRNAEKYSMEIRESLHMLLHYFERFVENKIGNPTLL